MRAALTVLLLGAACTESAARPSAAGDPRRSQAALSPAQPHRGTSSLQILAQATLAPVLISPAPHPLASRSKAELLQLLLNSPSELGSASIGEPHRGALFNGTQMPSSRLWEVVDPERAWATDRVIAELAHSIEEVHRRHPNTPTLYIGDMSRQRGGYLRPHRSHQSGRDADIGYYYKTGPAWYVAADAQNLDCARTWTLLLALLTGGEVEYLFIDHSVAELLRDHATSIGHSPATIHQLFVGDRRQRPVIRHTPGHRTHFHVRFYSEVARETGRRLFPLLRRRGLI
jgi:murein endopeptidase